MMDEKHKAILRRNRFNLVINLDLSSTCKGLLEKGVFNRDIIEKIKGNPGTRRDKARQVVLALETRGSQAFPLFLQCLQETGQHNLVELLKNGVPTVQLQPATPTEVVRPLIQPLPLTPAVNIVPLCPKLNDSPTPSPDRDYITPKPPGRTRRDSLQSYKMDASPCGHCLIINNVEFKSQSLSNRRGSNVDCEKLEKRFKALNFIVEVRTNLTQKQMRSELEALSKKDHSQYDCCVVIMLSHGTEVSHSRFPGAVFGVDGQNIPVQDITAWLNGHKCLSLQGKPKLFFIQACGGDEKDIGFAVSSKEPKASSGGEDDKTDAILLSSSSESLSMSDEPDARTTLPTPSDILVSYSTFPGYVSWRDTQSGSWYVETLDRILKENAADHDLVTMLTMVNDEVSQNSAKGLFKQMPGSFNFLRKLLYFQSHA